MVFSKVRGRSPYKIDSFILTMHSITKTVPELIPWRRVVRNPVCLEGVHVGSVDPGIPAPIRIVAAAKVTNLNYFYLKVPKSEIIDRSDFHDFYTMKSLREGDFGVKIFFFLNIWGPFGAVKFLAHMLSLILRRAVHWKHAEHTHQELMRSNVKPTFFKDRLLSFSH